MSQSDQGRKSENILKTRDDSRPIHFEDDGNNSFNLSKGDCSWLNEGQVFGVSELRKRIEPWLTSLFQSEHLSLLLGSGLTHAVHYLATDKSATDMGAASFTTLSQEINIAAQSSAHLAGRAKGNLEDQIRAANELLRGLEILSDPRAGQLRDDLTKILEKFSLSILKSEAGIILAEETKRVLAFNTLVSFLMSFSNRIGTRDRLNIFTTSYDRLIEAGAELAGLHLLDRFLGSLMPIFRSSRLEVDIHYNPPGIRGEPRYLEGVARFTKLHGSIDWIQGGKNIRRVGLPFGAENIEPY
ncbi:MAG: SIR2 family protein, partial [Gammaproteobacteria bacterium]